jgi:hypothetical protein
MHRAANKIRTWKPVPLPLDFQLALEGGNWAKALRLYQGHPYTAPPLDTFELLKLLFYKTPVSVAAVRARFEAKVRVNLAMRQRAPEQIEWATFWESLNRGDARVVSMALSGARVNGLGNQCGIAEACAVLLRTEGREWRTELVDNLPFATVTANNLVATTFVRGRWDLALEMLEHVRLTRADVANLWPTVAEFHWAVALAFVTAVPRSAVPFDRAIPSMLKLGCTLPVLAEHMERSRALNDVSVVAPLLDHAVRQDKDYAFAQRCMQHLVDIDAISHAAMAFFEQLCQTHSAPAVFDALLRMGVPLHRLTVEVLESMRFATAPAEPTTPPQSHRATRDDADAATAGTERSTVDNAESESGDARRGAKQQRRA